MPTTFRSDVRDGLYGLLTGFQSANPTLLHSAYRSRPGSFSDKWVAYVGSLSEPVITHTQGIRRRQMSPQVVLVGKMSEPSSETAVSLDDIVDAFLDYCTARPHAISTGTVIAPTSTEDVELEAEGTFYPAVIVTFGDAVIQEGRL